MSKVSTNPSLKIGNARLKLKVLLALFLVAITIPVSYIFHRTFEQLKKDSLYQYRTMAEDLTDRVDSRISQVLSTEESRGFEDYSFFKLAGNYLQLSPLANKGLGRPATTDVPGLVGYFQVDPEGGLSSPILPENPAPEFRPALYGISPRDLKNRRALIDRLHSVLASTSIASITPKSKLQTRAKSIRDATTNSKLRIGITETWFETRVYNKLGSLSSMDEGKDQSFDNDSAEIQELNEDKLTESLPEKLEVNPEQKIAQLRLDQQYANKKELKRPSQSTRGRRKVQVSLPQAKKNVGNSTDSQNRAGLAPPSSLSLSNGATSRILTFESEIDPFQFASIDRHHFALFRKVWRDGQRYVQGFLISKNDFIKNIFEGAFRRSSLSQVAHLILGYSGNIIQRYTPTLSDPSKPEILLSSSSLSAPLNNVELLITVNGIPTPSGQNLIIIMAFAVFLVLLVGTAGIYKLASSQIDLAKQRSDFVSAVSHELKTPLTSIRMYGEMLRSNYGADEEKKKTYYDFIFFESERLSRLISNVLQLSRMSNQSSKTDVEKLKTHHPRTLLQSIIPKIASQIEAAGFKLKTTTPDVSFDVEADEDSMAQIIINLVDNALKFSASADRKEIELGYHPSGKQVTFYVRDYGPGIPKGQMKNIFKLFYRAENEMTRTTPGTGIGLALVKELADKMNASVDLKNHEVGAEFQVKFEIAKC